MSNEQNPYIADPLQDNAVIFGPGQGKLISFKGGTITLKITSSLSRDQLGVYEISLDPGIVGAQLHFHRFMDETFIVTEGTLAVSHGTVDVEAGAGSVIYVPRFTPHGFANRSDRTVRLTLIFNPAQQREGFFLGLEQILSTNPVNPEAFLALYNRYDSYPVDPSNMLPSQAGVRG